MPVNHNLLWVVSLCRRQNPLLFKLYGTHIHPRIDREGAALDPTPAIFESPELPSWVKFSEHHPSSLSAYDDDDNFVLPKIADWAEAHRLYDCHPREMKLLVAETVDGNIEMVSRVLKRRFRSPADTVAALKADIGEVNLSAELMEIVLRRFGNDWIPAFGFFSWAKTQTGYVHSENCYNMMVAILGKCREFGLVQDVLEEMNEYGFVSMVTISQVIRRLGRASKWEDAIEVFRGMEEKFGLRKDSSGLIMLMDAFVKGNSVENAHKVFDEFTAEIPPEVNTFNVLIHGYCKARELGRAKEVMEAMKNYGFVPNAISYTCFIEARCREKDFRMVDRILEEMQRNGCTPSVVTYTVIMHALGKAKEINEAVKVYEKMKQNSCDPDAHFCSSLIFILCKSGRYKDARQVFDEMETQNLTPDVLTYNTMISAACAHSREEEALGLLMEMEKRGCMPNVETYAPLLKMCCRNKWIKVLKLLLSDMFRKGVSIDLGTYTLLVLALCKVGKLELACSYLEESVFKGMVPKESAYKLLVKNLEEKGMEKAKQEIQRLMSQVKLIFMTHGDEAGLMLPPKIAPIQVVVIPIWKKADEKGVIAAANNLNEILKEAGIRVKLDDTDQRTPGWKFNFWEMKGVPLRIEVGPRDVSSQTVVISRRDIAGKQGKVFGISMDPLVLIAYIKDRLDEIQASLLAMAISFRDSNIVDVSSYDELKAAISAGKWARGPWSASDEEELKVKEETGATIRCFPFEQPDGSKTCLMTGAPADEVAIFAKSY